jgi:Bacterial Ig domain
MKIGRILVAATALTALAGVAPAFASSAPPVQIAVSGPSSSVVAGVRFNISVLVINRGSRRTRAATVEVFAARLGARGLGNSLGIRYLRAIAPGSRSTLRFRANLATSTSVASYRLSACFVHEGPRAGRFSCTSSRHAVAVRRNDRPAEVPGSGGDVPAPSAPTAPTTPAPAPPAPTPPDPPVTSHYQAFAFHAGQAQYSLPCGYSLDGDPPGPGVPPSTSTLATKPAHGTVQMDPDCKWAYTPDPDFEGTDVFTYDVHFGDSIVIRTEVDVFVYGVATGVDDAVTTPADTPVTIDVLANDLFPPGPARGAAPGTQAWGDVISAPAHGKVETTYEPTLTYTPDPGFHGTDTFTYQPNSWVFFYGPGILTGSSATVTITVQ